MARWAWIGLAILSLCMFFIGIWIYIRKIRNRPTKVEFKPDAPKEGKKVEVKTEN